MPTKRAGNAPLPRTGNRSGTRDVAAQRAACDEMLREAESTDIYAAVLAEAQSDPGRTCHVWYHRTKRDRTGADRPHQLLVHGVVTRDFDSLTIKWQEKPGSATKADKFWNHKTDQVKPFISLAKLNMYARECTRVMTGRDDECTVGGDLATMMIDIPLAIRDQHKHTLRLVGLDPRLGQWPSLTSPATLLWSQRGARARSTTAAAPPPASAPP